MQKYWAAFFLAAAVGIIGGLQGNAGSLYILTGLLMFNIVDNQKTAAGTALLYTSFPLTAGAAYQYYTKGNVDIKLAAILVSTAAICSTIGAKLNYMIPEKYTVYSIGVMMFLSSFYYFHKGYTMIQ
jgi:uncharacterized membrane protein YfcA